jgi:hypothetical protein
MRVVHAWNPLRVLLLCCYAHSYSADHKERLLSYVASSGKPWMLLLPNYVANKSYYSDILGLSATPAREEPRPSTATQHARADRSSAAIKMGAPKSQQQQPFFLVPASKYEYQHPEVCFGGVFRCFGGSHSH